MAIKMKAIRRFRMRMANGGLMWIKPGEEYEADEKLAAFHEQTGRGEKVKAAKTKKGE